MIELARHPAFRAADVHTGFIPEHMDSLFPKLQVSESVLTQAAVAVILNESQATRSQLRTNNPFVLEQNLRLNHIGIRNIRVKFDGVGMCRKLVK